MSSVQNLDNLTMLPTIGLAVQHPAGFAGVQGTTGIAADSNKTIADKAVQDSKDIPSIWFVNFPSEDAASHKEMLAKYLQAVEDYRWWASLIWWKTVYAEENMHEDGSPQSIARCSAYCARVANHHMRITPWKSIESQITEFHTKLIQAVLDGFVTVTPGMILALEGILESLRKTMGQSQGDAENRTIVCQRYEYMLQNDSITSVVRIIAFTMTDSIRNVQNAKKSETRIKCEMTYSGYQANFHERLRSLPVLEIDNHLKTATREFCKKQTIDSPP